ncbi:methylthioribulose-1-phosphate dehydratase [Polycladomyces abyssicola]|uniref:Methylthioribulose-1-phosphate dehydratase n=2 Tax=Polycladomyces abyssicola TaxID=1125966 RepID=A0A8D5ZLZ0_9BACL|nr:methylthioribulose-1-phosphate dehydratase [Polycladomyces abyssicola]
MTVNQTSNRGIEVPLESVQQAFDTLRRIKMRLAERGWFPATSGNLSVKVTYGGASVIAITASGKDKAVHTPEDFLLVDENGVPVAPTELKPSAETAVHTALYRKFPECGAVFHVHTVSNNLVSELYGDNAAVTFTNHELIKALGHWEEGASVTVPIVPNHAHIPALAAAVERVAAWDNRGVLIRNHGIYAWGDDAFSALRHLEAWEFLFEYEIKRRLLMSG